MEASGVLLAASLSELASGIDLSLVGLITGVALTISLACWLPHGAALTNLRRVVATLSGVVGLIGLWWSIPALVSVSDVGLFWALAALTVGSAIATISSRNPVYCAIWFAVSLLGTAALFFLQNAQFLGIATVAVYAGAIVVTFLFVLMLSQPTGHAFYDRISWGTWPRVVTSAGAAIFVGLVSWLLAGTDIQQLTVRDSQMQAVQETLVGELATLEVRSLQYEVNLETGARQARVAVRVAPAELPALREQRAVLEKLALDRLQEVVSEDRPQAVRLSWEDLQTPAHMAQLGGRLFSRHWVSIQAAGALLMAALVGAVAIASRDGAHREG